MVFLHFNEVMNAAIEPQLLVGGEP